MSKRAKRRFDAYKKYRNRLKTWLPFYNPYRSDKPESWKELEKDPWSKHLKDTPTPCSCGMCQPDEDKYDRNKQKNIDNEIVKDELDEWEQRWCEWDDLNRFYGQTG